LQANSVYCVRLKQLFLLQMNRSLKKLIIVLCLGILLPVAIYSGYEISTLTENERELKTIYERQLEAVLFSVNLHSQDLVNSTVSKLENSGILDQQATHQDSSTLLANFFLQSSFLEAIHLSQYGGENQKLYLASELTFDAEEWAAQAQKLQQENQELIEQLIKYQKSGFRKLQPLRSITLEGITYNTLVFIRTIEDKPYICTLFFNPDDFSQQVLIPKLQMLGQQDFELSILQGKDSVLFNTSDTLRAATVTKEMWLLPTHQLGISPIGKTLQELTQERNMLNLLSLALLMVFILIGVFIIFRNLRREMDLAQQKSEFVSNVSHEIRTPLALISMFAETLSLGRVKKEERKKEYYEIITKETARLANIVNRILNFSKIEANKKEYQLETVDLNAIVEDVLYTYSFHIENKGFSYSITTGDLPPIQADKEAITESIVNLIDNAMKYSPESKKFEIETGVNRNEAYIAVKDYGIGIAQKNIPSLFDKFYRVPQGDIHNAKGSGLGLSIVKHIMDAHHGKIEVDSKPNVGSNFRLVFPTNEKQLHHV